MTAPDVTLPVEVAYATATVQHVVPVRLRGGATVADALAAVAGISPFDELDLGHMAVGVYGEVVSDRSRRLRAHDRVEVYRPLLVDPRTARRRRAG